MPVVRDKEGHGVKEGKAVGWVEMKMCVLARCG